MNAEELIRMARKQADYNGWLVKVLEENRDITVEGARRDLDEKDLSKFLTVMSAINLMIEQHGQPVILAITVIAFEIQIENAKMKQSERNN